MKVFAVIGGKGTGKTTFVTNRLEQVPSKKSILVNYGDDEPYLSYSKATNRAYIDEDDFIPLVKNSRGVVAVFEEATIFFKTRSQNKDMTRILTRSRHTKNTIFVIFHSLRAMPDYIFELVNYIVLFKTNDNPQRVDQKFKSDELNEVVERVKKSDDMHYYEIFETVGNFTHENT